MNITQGPTMGWRAFLRSAQANARRVQRESEREERQIARAHQSVNRMLGQLSAEAQREIVKVQTYEDKLYRTPIRTLQLRFHPSTGWQCQPYVDRSGQIEIEFQVGLTSSAVDFEPASIPFEGRAFQPLACAVSQYATFIAFSIHVNADAPGTRSRRLINRSSPEKSRIVLVSNGQIYMPFDGTFDAPPVPGHDVVAIAAFEPFALGGDSFQIAFLPRETKENTDPDPMLIEVAGPDFGAEIDDIPNAPSLVHQIQQLVSAKLNETVAKSHPAKQRLPSQSRPEKQPSPSWFDDILRTFGLK